MATLKEKMFYINNGFKNGGTAIDGNTSLIFLNDVLNEISSDQSNFIEFEKDIPYLYNTCIEELKIAPQETKTILLKNVLKNSGIDSSIKDDLITNKPIFKDFLESKSPSEIYDEVDVLYNFAFDEKYKRIEIDALISAADKAIAKKPDNSILSTYFKDDKFDKEKLTKVMAAIIVLKDFNDTSDYGLTENQKNILNDTVIRINKSKSEDKDFSNFLDEKVENYKKFMFFNSLNVEAQLHEIKNNSELDGSGGFISSHPIEESLTETLKNKEKRDNSKIDVSVADWEKKYSDYLKSINNIKIMTLGDKFKSRFASHGFAPATASLFGDSIVLSDKFGDPEKTLWNISALTGTMRLSRDVDYSDPNVSTKAFGIAALQARRKKWPTVYLNHPGPDPEAKQFLEASIKAMVEIGQYSFDEIKVPRKYQHVLDFVKNSYTYIENGNGIENNGLKTEGPNGDGPNSGPDGGPDGGPNGGPNGGSNGGGPDGGGPNGGGPNGYHKETKSNVLLKNGTDLSGFDKDNAIFENIDLDNNKDLNLDSNNQNLDLELDLNNQDLYINDLNVDYIGNEDYIAPDLGDMDFNGIDFGDTENKEKRDFNLGDLNLSDSSLEILKENSNDKNVSPDLKTPEKKPFRLFKNQ